MKLSYGPGAIVTYNAFGGIRRRVVVTDREDDVKNGRPGFCGYLVENPDFHVWGYDNQIVSVEPA